MKTVNVHFILDKSGSMASVRDATISGFNEYLDGLRRDKKASYKLTLTLFDTNVDKREMVTLAKAKSLDAVSYNPDGMTALYDAVCQTLNDVKDMKGKNLVVIMTDGEENSSREYTQENFKEKVKELEAKKNWTFVFLGANQDSWATAQKFGFSAANVANYNNTSRGITATMDCLVTNTSAYAAMSLDKTNNFFTQADKDKLSKS